MTDDLKPIEFKSEEERLIAALAVAVLGLDLIARSKGSNANARNDARVVLNHLAERYAVTPENT